MGSIARRKKFYPALWKLLREEKLDAPLFAAKLRVHAKEERYTQNYVSNRLAGQCDWTREDMYAILAFFGLSDQMLPLIFPSNKESQPTRATDRINEIPVIPTIIRGVIQGLEMILTEEMRKPYES